MKVSLCQTLIILVSSFVYSRSEVLLDVSNENESGLLRTRNLNRCPYSMGTPCWGVQVCRVFPFGERRTQCVTPSNLRNSDECGKCSDNNDETTKSPTSSPTSSPNLSPTSSPTLSPTSSPTLSPTSGSNNNNNDTGDANPQEGNPDDSAVNQDETDSNEASTGDEGNREEETPENDTPENNGADTAASTNRGNRDSGNRDSISVSNRGSCPFSQQSPCFGVPVCRLERGVPVNKCLSAGLVRRSDQCGYCEDDSNNNVTDEATPPEENTVGDLQGNENTDGAIPPEEIDGDNVDGGNEGTDGANPPEENNNVDGNEDTGGANPQEETERVEDKEFLPNRGNCPFSQKSPCFGVPVCRLERGVPKNKCLSAGLVRQSDQCGYCDGEV